MHEQGESIRVSSKTGGREDVPLTPPADSNYEGNRAAHIDTTGPEIWSQTQRLPGGLDAFICSTGTGGTLAGITRVLKEKSNGKIQCWLADPPGSVLEGFVNRGVIERGGGSITEGESAALETLRHRR